jgi:hypothetical protein
MQMIGENVTDAQLSDMLALADLDKDGRINYEGEQTPFPRLSSSSSHSSSLSRVCTIAVVNSPRKTSHKETRSKNPKE